MRRPAPQRDMPPPLELECLKELWGIGEGTVRDVRDVMFTVPRVERKVLVQPDEAELGMTEGSGEGCLVK